MTAILTFEEVEALDLEACRRALNLLERTYRLNTAFSELSQEERDHADLVGNTLLYLEDRIGQSGSITVASGVLSENLISKSSTRGPRRRQFRIGTEIYLDIQTACLKTGIKLNTLKTYVSRKPEMYGYVD